MRSCSPTLPNVPRSRQRPSVVYERTRHARARRGGIGVCGGGHRPPTRGGIRAPVMKFAEVEGVERPGGSTAAEPLARGLPSLKSTISTARSCCWDDYTAFPPRSTRCCSVSVNASSPRKSRPDRSTSPASSVRFSGVPRRRASHGPGAVRSRSADTRLNRRAGRSLAPSARVRGATLPVVLRIIL